MSETREQQHYEQAILHKHYRPEQVGSDGNYLANDISPRMNDAENEATGSNHSSRIKHRFLSFWEKKVVPAFPEAVADITLLKATLKVEAMVTKDIRDATKHPEIAQVATVRRGFELSPQEVAFREARKARVKDAFCRYLGLDAAEVHIDDVPIVAFGGSGGGYRAMLGLLGYSHGMKQSGLWDLLTYVAGVSGSCWSLAAYYTWADASMEAVIEHCKRRLSPYHPLSPEAIRDVLHSPGGPTTTIGPIVQKHHSGLHTVAMDLYSVFTTGHLFLRSDPNIDPKGMGVRKEVAGYHDQWYKWSSAQRYINDGTEPLPILTAIRHERPWKDWADAEHPFVHADPHTKEQQEASDAWFNWFELSPIEVGCDELEAWVPTWAFGRPFERGQDVMQLPEQSLALLLGLCTSAPAGPLTSYLATIKRSLPSGFIGNSIQDMAKGITRLWGREGTEEFQGHHPLHAVNEHNFMFHLTKSEAREQPSPPVENSPRIHLIDSGMDNNCPTYVMLHPRRYVDVVLNMDASSDVLKDSFQERVDQIASRRSLRFARRSPKPKPDPESDKANQFKGLYAQIYDGNILVDRPEKVVDSYGHTVTNPPAPPCLHKSTMIYMPLLPNETAVPDFDPSTAKFSGSYNLVWTPEQVEMLITVCLANFADSEDNIKDVLREAWLKKRKQREGGDASVAL